MAPVLGSGGHGDHPQHLRPQDVYTGHVLTYKTILNTVQDVGWFLYLFNIWIKDTGRAFTLLVN